MVQQLFAAELTGYTNSIFQFFSYSLHARKIIHRQTIIFGRETDRLFCEY
jgi:hypothetical protein